MTNKAYNDTGIESPERRAYSLIEVKSVDKEQRIIRGIATSPSPDRVGDIVDPFGVKVAGDIPLFLYHDSTKTVGRASFGKATAKGIPFEARLPMISEPGTLKDRVDEAWGMVKHGLITAVSIGFRVLDDAYENIKGGGLKFNRTEVMELSLVPVPAQPDAVIQGWKAMGEDAQRDALITQVKKLDVDSPAASGQLRTGVVRLDNNSPGVSGTQKQTRTKGTEMKTYAEQIAGFEAKKAATIARRDEIQTKAMDESRTKDASERDEFLSLTNEIKSIEEELADLREMEKTNVIKAEPVTRFPAVPGTATPRAAVQIKNTQKLEPGQEFARYAMCLIAAKGDEEKALRIAQREYPESERVVKALELNTSFRGGLSKAMEQADLMQIDKAAVAAGTTTGTTWLAPLVQYQDFAGDFVEFLRPQTILGKFGVGNVPALNRVPFNVRIAGQTSGGAGYWVGEGAPKPVTSFDFNSTTLRWTKVANIAVLTQESIRFSNPSAELLVRNALRDALVERLDIDFIDPGKAAVANVSPASITNGVTPIAPSGGDAAALRRDLQALWAPFIAANNPPTTAVYIMSATLALAIAMMRNDLDTAQAFPGMTMMGGTLDGIPVIVSEYTDNSAGSSGSLLILANARDIWLADDGQVNVDASDQASLQMDTAPTNNSATPTATTLVSMWQTNSVAFRAERFINWQKRRVSAVQYIDGANYR